MRASGCVYFIDGADAPAPLLTVEGVARLQRADVIVYDEPCRVAVLNYGRRGARLQSIRELLGDSGGSVALIPHLVRWSRDGLEVARLRATRAGKASVGNGEEGDPEVEGVHRAGVPYRLIPGVAALPRAGNCALPLDGCRVMVTRSREQAKALSERVLALGGEAVEFATIRIQPPPHWAPLDAALQAGAARYHWLVFTSVNGVRAFLGRIQEGGFDVREWRGARVAAVGPATAAALEEAGLRVDLVPEEYRGEAVAEAMGRFESLSGKRVALVRALHGREELPRGLRKLGALVDDLPAYETVADGEGAPLAAALLGEGQVHVVTFTSPSTVRHFCAAIPDAPTRLQAAGTLVACIGPVTAEAAQAAGLPVDVMPAEYTVPALVDAIAARWQGTGTG